MNRRLFTTAAGTRLTAQSTASRLTGPRTESTAEGRRAGLGEHRIEPPVVEVDYGSRNIIELSLILL